MEASFHEQGEKYKSIPKHQFTTHIFSTGYLLRLWEISGSQNGIDEVF
jgi:hypothetical protein